MTHSFRKKWLLALAVVLTLVVSCGSGGSKGEQTPRATEVSVTATPLTNGQTNASSPTVTAIVDADHITLTTEVSTEYYPVTGLNTVAIFDSIDKNGPRDDKGVKGSGLTAATWGYRWQPQSTPDGCVIASMTISLDIVVTLPLHQQEALLPPELAPKWQAFAESVDVHEQRHVDIDQAGAQTIRAMMAAIPPAASCDALTRQVDSLWTSQQRIIAQQQDEFHAQEDVRIAAKRAPLQSQIDVNRARIAELAKQIAGLDTSLAQINEELSSTDEQLEALITRISEILESYPDGNLPAEVYVEHENLRRLYNALAPTFNELVNQYNGAIALRNKVADEHDHLVDATNELVDQYNWTR